jgi:cytoskeletal protein CcmA (bactofilin family)
MPTVTGNSTVNIITWSQTQQSVRYFDVYRRPDSVTADITTANIVAKVAAGSNHYTDPVDNAPYWYWVKAISWAGKSSAFSATIVGSPSDTLTGEPVGFPNTTDSVHSFTGATRTYSISPAVTSFDYYTRGIKYTITAAQTVQVANSSGLTIIALDSAGITSQKDPTDAQMDNYIRTKALCGMVYYSTAAGTETYFGEERHGIIMNAHTHTYLHFTTGMRYMTGLALNTITSDQTGDLDTHAQFGVDTGSVADEDLDNLPAAVLSTTGLEVYYRDTDTYWRKSTNAGFSILVGASPRMQYNPAGVWGLAEVTNGRYALCHVFGSGEVDNPVFAVVGQYEYTTVIDARQGATTEMNALLLGDLPSEEMVPLGTVIFQTSNGYGNAVKSRIRTTDEGDDYVDWRTTSLGRGSGASHHGSLSGLSDDDHNQYLLLAGRGGQVIDDSLTICGATTLNNTLAVSGTLTVDGAATLKSTLDVSGATTIHNTLHASGAVTLGATLVASGAVSINNTLAVSGTLTVDGATVLKSTLNVSGATTINNTLNISGDLTLQNGNGFQNTAAGSITINGNLNPTADNTYSIGKNGVTYANMFSVAKDTFYDYVHAYIELTAQTSTPATPGTGGMIRLFAKDTGGVTKFCMIDTAGTVTQFGSGGGGASLALDNLDTVAINTSLVSDTNYTDDLGTDGTRWKDIYGYTVYVGSASAGAYFTGLNNNTVGFTGGGAGSGGLIPSVNNNEALGASGWAWREFHAESAFVTNLSVAGTATFTGNVAFDSNVVISGTLTTHNAITANQIVRINDALIVSSNTTLRSTLSVEGSISASAQTFTCGWVDTYLLQQR